MIQSPTSLLDLLVKSLLIDSHHQQVIRVEPLAGVHQHAHDIGEVNGRAPMSMSIRAWLGHVSLDTTLPQCGNHPKKKDGRCCSVLCSRRNFDIFAPK
jgi:hypothetical protein